MGIGIILIKAHRWVVLNELKNTTSFNHSNLSGWLVPYGITLPVCNDLCDKMSTLLKV